MKEVSKFQQIDETILQCLMSHCKSNPHIGLIASSIASETGLCFPTVSHHLLTLLADEKVTRTKMIGSLIKKEVWVWQVSKNVLAEK